MDVGRQWYVRITKGTVGARADLGTYHVATGTQQWDQAELALPDKQMTEREVLDELYYALSVFLEKRTG